MKAAPTCKQILDASSHGVIATDAKGVILFANARIQDFFGLHPAALSGAPISKVLTGAASLVMASLATGTPQLGRHIEGNDRSLLLNITLIRAPGGIKGAVCSFQEMEQLESSALKLESYKHLNRQLHAIFQSSSDGIWVCDGQGRVININEASEKLNGIKAGEVIGKMVSEILAQGSFDRSVTLEVLETKRQVSLIQHLKTTRKILLVTGTPVFDEAGTISMVVVNERDMTQLNAIREELEQSRMVTEKFQEELAELSLLELKKQEIIATNSQMRQVLRIGLKLAHLEASNILILGESGTGKGLLAKFIHKNSKRQNNPFVQINCAALPENLLEAELFGYERGAFTGAREQGKIGLFELAHGGTLFLDEIGDLPFSVQAKLLKYLDDQEIMRLGSLKPRKIDCTVIAATNRDLEELTRIHQFRQDLFYRLNTFTIRIPPLRERPEDIFELVNYFLRSYNRTYDLKRRVSPEALKVLQSYPFPGNVRELKNILKTAVLMGEKDVVDDDLMGGLGIKVEQSTPPKRALKEGGSLTDEISTVEKQILEKALAQCKTTRELARQLGISQPTVVRKLKKYALSLRLIHS
jgi:PAS domain S-box-containing protein/TyrR family helix-turn-helix protein